MFTVLYMYVLKIAYVSRLKAKVESQGFICCRLDGYVMNEVLYCLKQFLWLLKTFVLSVVLNIMVDKGSLSSCVVIVVVVVIRSLGCGITLA